MSVKSLFSAAAVPEEELQTERVYQRSSVDIVHGPGGTIVRPTDATTTDLMNLVEVSGTLDFWNDPEEDLYTESDGDAV